MADLIKSLTKIKEYKVGLTTLRKTSSKFVNKLYKFGFTGPFSLKPCCRSYSTLCLLRCLVRFDDMMCSINLQHMQVREMGL